MLSKHWRGATNVIQSNRSWVLFVEFNLYLASRFVGKFGGKVFVKIELKKWLKEVKELQVRKKLCQMKRLLFHSLNLVRLAENKGVVL